jgi:hypothetical protein
VRGERTVSTHHEENRTTISNSTLSSSPVATGSGARAEIRISETDADVGAALDDVRRHVAELAQQDDASAERAAVLATRLKRLEEQLAAPQRNRSRILEVLGSLREGAAGLAGLSTSVAALWSVVEKVLP